MAIEIYSRCMNLTYMEINAFNVHLSSRALDRSLLCRILTIFTYAIIKLLFFSPQTRVEGQGHL